MDRESHRQDKSTAGLNERGAALYQEWIANDRHARALLTQMRELATKATELILTDTPDTQPKFNRNLGRNRERRRSR